MMSFELRFVETQIRRKNKDAPNLGHPTFGTRTRG